MWRDTGLWSGRKSGGSRGRAESQRIDPRRPTTGRLVVVGSTRGAARPYRTPPCVRANSEQYGGKFGFTAAASAELNSCAWRTAGVARSNISVKTEWMRLHAHGDFSFSSLSRFGFEGSECAPLSTIAKWPWSLDKDTKKNVHILNCFAVAV